MRYVSSVIHTAVVQIHRTKLEAKIESVEADEAGIYVDFEVSTSSHMSLPIPHMLLYLPTQWHSVLM